jgi:hypothetical protein
VWTFISLLQSIKSDIKKNNTDNNLTDLYKLLISSVPFKLRTLIFDINVLTFKDFSGNNIKQCRCTIFCTDCNKISEEIKAQYEKDAETSRKFNKDIDLKIDTLKLSLEQNTMFYNRQLEMTTNKPRSHHILFLLSMLKKEKCNMIKRYKKQLVKLEASKKIIGEFRENICLQQHPQLPIPSTITRLEHRQEYKNLKDRNMHHTNPNNIIDVYSNVEYPVEYPVLQSVIKPTVIVKKNYVRPLDYKVYKNAILMTSLSSVFIDYK